MHVEVIVSFWHSAKDFLEPQQPHKPLLAGHRIVGGIVFFILIF